MASGGGVNVASLFASLGLNVNQAQWAQGSATIRQAQVALNQLAAGTTTLSRLLAGGTAAVQQHGTASAAAATKAQRQWDSAAAAIQGYLAYLGGSFAYDKLIASNQEYEDRLISLGAILQGNLNVSFVEARKQAEGLNDEFQRFDQAGAPATMREIADFGKGVAAGVFAAKGSVKDLVEITEQGVIAGKVLAGGRNAGYAALEITEMLMGNVSNRMMMVRQLLSMIHMSEDEFRSLDEKGRLAAVKKALSSPAMKDASTAFSDSFSGIETTIVSKFEIMARKVGLAVFERLKVSLKDLSAWLDANDAKIQAFANTVSDVLVNGFNAVVTVIKFLAEHGKVATVVLSALGALLVATAARAVMAWLAFLGPIGLIIVAVGAVVGVIIAYWDDIEEAFAGTWDRITDDAHDAWEAIKKGFSAAVDWISDLPGIKQLLELMEWVKNHAGVGSSVQQVAEDTNPAIGAASGVLGGVLGMGGLLRGRALLSSPPELPRSGEGDTQPLAMSVSIGDIHVHSTSADAGAVADEVNKTIADHLGGVFRRTMDEVA